jgi:hypothetical protein
MLEYKKKIVSVLCFFLIHLLFLGYLNKDTLDIIYRSIGLEISEIIKLSFSFFILILNILLIKKNKFFFNLKNFDLIDRIFFCFLLIFFINSVAAFFIKDSLHELKNIYLLVILLLSFVVFRKISYNTIEYNFLSSLAISLYILFLIITLKIAHSLYLGHDDIFGSSTNAIGLIFFILYTVLLEKSRSSKEKLMYFLIYFICFYILSTKIFIIFATIIFLFSINKIFYIFKIKNLFYIFIFFYITLTFVFPMFYNVFKNKNSDLDWQIIEERRPSSIIFICKDFTQLNVNFTEKKKYHIMQTEYPNEFMLDRILLFCKKNNSLIEILSKNNLNDLLISLTDRLSNYILSFQYAKKNYFLPSVYDYADHIQKNHEFFKQAGMSKTSHSSFNSILLRLGVFGLFLIFALFYKILLYQKRDDKKLYQVSLIFILIYYCLNDQLFFNNILSSLAFWLFCSQIALKKKTNV